MQDAALDAVYAATSAYYSDKATRHGATPFGVDWTCVATQHMRFVQLLRVCAFKAPFALNDVGCGYGALRGFLDEHHAGCNVDYLGIDVSPTMIALAQQAFAGRDDASFAAGPAMPRQADYAVASGIFNVCLDQPLASWEVFVAVTLKQMAATSLRGFAVNFVTVAAPGLYAANPAQWVEFCTRCLNVETELVCDYGLREFTLLGRIRKTAPT